MLRITFCIISILFLMMEPVFGEKLLYDEILVTVNNRIITKNEVEIALAEHFQEQRIQSVSEMTKKEKRQQVLEQLIDNKLLDIEAERLNLAISDDELDQEIDRFQKIRKLTKSSFESLLRSQNITLFTFRKIIHDRMRRERVIRSNVRFGISITDSDLKEAYSKLNSEFKVRARHILRLIPTGSSEKEVMDARDEVINITDKIKNGASFTEMADMYSQDPSVKSNHGDLGFFTKKDMVKEFAEVAFSLPEGQLSEPVRTKFGFHLIEVLEKKMMPKPPFESIKEKLHSIEYQKRFESRLKEYLTNLREKSKIVYK